MSEYIKIFIVEDQPFWQNMITRQLNVYPEFLVVGIAETVDQAIQLGSILDYNMIILDLQLDQTEEDGFRVYNELKKTRNLQAIFLTNNEDPHTMYNAFLLGGFSYIPKTYLNVLPQTIRYLHENPAPKLFMNAIADKVKEFRLVDLTSAEKSIFDLLKQGLKPVEISRNLNITLYTVRSHIRNVLKKLEVSSYKEAVKKLYCVDIEGAADEGEESGS
ncbi:MAG: response regulator transcription factor [Firmicutes bacterium]|nr:response regulator transcription factor [Bacillota bacterium]